MTFKVSVVGVKECSVTTDRDSIIVVCTPESTGYETEVQGWIKYINLPLRGGVLRINPPPGGGGRNHSPSLPSQFGGEEGGTLSSLLGKKEEGSSAQARGSALRVAVLTLGTP